jgi:hypothetical protein
MEDVESDVFRAIVLMGVLIRVDTLSAIARERAFFLLDIREDFRYPKV